MNGRVTVPCLMFLSCWTAMSCLQAFAADVPDRVDFNWHVKPILSDRCFFCHGPDDRNRQADLRLDTREGLFAALEYAEGSHVVRPGDPGESELYLRISADADGYRMPPADSKLSLTRDEIAVLRRWIEQGAEWKQHWSLVPPERVSVPEVQDQAWPRNEIDRFVLARLEREGLQPAVEADRERLIRRVTLDLTGLPPTIDEIDAFLADNSPQAYERLVDRLLASERFGERMAIDWLDAARYADTFGYQADVYRDVWPYRDWVIRALNENLPFDRFLTWQLAGDLLPDATRDQRIATAFNRLHRQTNEGGSVEEEFRVDYVADRTDTLGAAFLGLTLGCARCHDHKYDPVSQREYYQLFAFFGNIDECGLYSHFTNAMPTPTLLLTNDRQQADIDAAEAAVRQAEQRLETLRSERSEAFDGWLAQRLADSTTGPPPDVHDSAPIPVSDRIGDFPLESIENGQLANRAEAAKPAKVFEDPQVVPGRLGNGLLLSGENNITTAVGGDFTRDDSFSVALWIWIPDRKDRAVIFHRSRAWTDAGSRGYQLLIEDGRLSASLVHFWPGNAIGIHARDAAPLERWVHVVMAYDGSSRADGLALYVDGRRADCQVVRDHLVKDITGGGANELTVGQRFRDRGFKDGKVDELQVYQRCLTPIEAAQLADGKSLDRLLALPSEQWTDAERQQLYEYYLSSADEVFRAALAELRQLRRRRSSLVEPVQELMVMHEMPEPRPTYVLARGAYDAPGEQVQPAAPTSILPFDPELPRNRLGLARWLTDPRHPLTARVAVNRFWQTLFGRGLVTTPDDFGSQGQLPTHPELLDWLAVSFVESGWDVKATIKRMVMSSTYRQASECAAELRSRDPQNELLARGRSYRWPAEIIRDHALAASGLLVERIGGPPVKPYEPEGLWEEKSGAKYQRDAGEGSRRRSLYTYWKRTSPPPAMMTLDAAKREVCVVARQTTATPLQSLVLLNDPQYVEAARALAERVMAAEAESGERLTRMFRLLTSRKPAEAELQVLQSLLEQQRTAFAADGDAVTQFLEVGDHRPDPAVDRIELAAMAVVAQALLNYDETVMKR
ncbi:MAG: DUF1553 domain-containing protein [Pirellulaceae bacterium]|nr:DUF1553 domain-containing protein [Pirellulaceae bacterium]